MRVGRVHDLVLSSPREGDGQWQRDVLGADTDVNSLINTSQASA
jgi:hypothetical protein